MIPDPLHPAVVHLPLALALVTPLLAVVAALAIRLRFLPARSWAAVVLLQALLLGSGWLAHETGEEDEDRVEEVVGHEALERHEERAETFLWLAGLALVLTVPGLVGSGRLGDGARALAILALLATLVAGLRTGHAGGELVYRHGAADAHLDRGTAGTSATRRERARYD